MSMSTRKLLPDLDPVEALLGRFQLFAEGDEGEGGGGEAEAGEGANEGDGQVEGGDGEKQPDPADWRAMLKSDDARKFAESSPDVNHLVRRALDLQKVASVAITPLAKDAEPEEVAAYRKRIGVPEAADGYKFTMPSDGEPTERDKQFQGVMGQSFHDLNITADQAAGLNEVWNKYAIAVREAQAADDKKYADESDAELHRNWPGKEYVENDEHSERAAIQMFGDDMDEMRNLETNAGRFVLDHPVMKRALAAVGREMVEGGMVPPLSASDKDAVDDQLREVRGKITEAQGRGDNREANRLYQTEQQLIGKLGGAQPIVGAAGRAA